MNANLDVSAVRTRVELHELLARHFSFPAYYGKNWDAFDECAGDLDARSLPPVLTVRGLALLAARLPEEAAVFRDCLKTLATERPTCEIRIEA